MGLDQEPDLKNARLHGPRGYFGSKPSKSSIQNQRYDCEIAIAVQFAARLESAWRAGMLQFHAFSPAKLIQPYAVKLIQPYAV